MKNEKQFNHVNNDMLIIGLIYILIILFSCYIKNIYELENQSKRTVEAMELSIELHKDLSYSESKNEELIQFINFQKKYYESEIKTYKKYDKIIKDIDRNWKSKWPDRYSYVGVFGIIFRLQCIS